MKPCKRVAIVGAGLSGVLMARSLDEENIDFVCYEKSAEIGGMWRYRTEPCDGIVTILPTTVTYYSKEMESVSNHPWPPESLNFKRHRDAYDRILQLAEKVDFQNHVLFNEEVVCVKMTLDYEITGRWLITSKNTKTDKISCDVFDGVMLCTGHTGDPVSLEYPDLKVFQGTVVHTHDLKDAKSFYGQNVLVVGFNSEALDVAVEVGQVAKKVFVSSRKRSWILPRFANGGMPLDFFIFRRFLLYLLNIVKATQVKYLSYFVERYLLDMKFNSKLYGINPSAPALCRDPVISEEIIARLLSKVVVLKNRITKVGFNTVVFEGDTDPTKIDTIILATGYEYNFAYLEDGIIDEQEKGNYQLYKLMYPPHLKHPTLALIGFLKSWGSDILLAELQTRWATQVLTCKSVLPDQETMMEDVTKRYRYNRERYPHSDHVSLHVDIMPYADDIASQIGSKPNFMAMLFRDPKLYFACIFGSFSSHQYRLEGPHTWEGARDAVLSTKESVINGCSGKKLKKLRSINKKTICLRLFVIMLLYTLYQWSTSSWVYRLIYVACLYVIMMFPTFLKFGFVVYVNPLYAVAILVYSIMYFVSVVPRLIEALMRL